MTLHFVRELISGITIQHAASQKTAVPQCVSSCDLDYKSLLEQQRISIICNSLLFILLLDLYQKLLVNKGFYLGNNSIIENRYNHKTDIRENLKRVHISTLNYIKVAVCSSATYCMYKSTEAPRLSHWWNCFTYRPFHERGLPSWCAILAMPFSIYEYIFSTSGTMQSTMMSTCTIFSATLFSLTLSHFEPTKNKWAWPACRRLSHPCNTDGHWNNVRYCWR